MKQVKLNKSISFDALKGLIARANDNEKLWVADEWLRENKVITIPQFHELRELWNKQFKSFGIWKVTISCGKVRYDYAKGSYKDMYRICKDSHWTHNYNNGCVWDMEIEEA